MEYESFMNLTYDDSLGEGTEYNTGSIVFNVRKQQ